MLAFFFFFLFFFVWTMPFNLLVSTFATNSTDLLQTSLRVQLYNQASGCERWAPGPSLYCPSSAWGQSYWKTGLQSWQMKSLLAKKKIIQFFSTFSKIVLLFYYYYHVIMFLLLLILSVSCIFILLNQNNPTAVWLRLTEMHNEKTWFLKIINNGVICFCKLTLHIHIKYTIYAWVTLSVKSRLKS